MTKVLIIDAETNGLDGGPADKVLEVGIAEVDGEAPTSSAVRPVYSQAIRHGDIGDCWIFHNSTLSPEEVQGSAVGEKQAARIVREIVRGRLVTSYNTDFDFRRFLDRRPWYLGRSYAAVPFDIMRLATSSARDLYD